MDLRFYSFFFFIVNNISCLTDARNNARISSASSDASEESIGTTFRHELDKVPHKDKVQASKEKTEDESPTSTVCEGRLKESSVENIHIDETTSSHSVMQSKKKSNKNMEAFKITLGDRPIIGMVSAQWNEKEKSQISHKWWDGNGIPNSTNKYKEVTRSCFFFRISRLLFSTFLLFCYMNIEVTFIY